MIRNNDARYGLVTKILHWTVFVLFLHQFTAAAAMLNTPQGDTTLGFTQGTLYEWHKSVGLMLLAIALFRYLWRRFTPLPEWAPNLSADEKRAIHWIERTLYTCMVLMPVSGYLFVMAGGFGVRLFDVWPLPNVIGEHKTMATVAQWTHAIAACVIVVALVAHWSLGIRHQRRHRDRYLHRMLPFTHQA